MRADKRSFSFTWMRGNNNNKDNAVPDTGIDNPMRMDIAATTQNDAVSASWYMTNASTSSSSSGVSSMSGSSLASSMSTETANGAGNNPGNDLSHNDSKGRLRRLGHSFTRFGTKYSIIEDEEENQPIPMNSDETSEEAMPTSSTSGNNTDPEQIKKPEPVHFDEDGNFIGRQGKLGSCKKPANKDVGPSATASSLGRKLNKTVQDVKASIGNFSQKFRRSTRRRYRMGRGTPLNEITPTRKILGRTPTKLYSPFEIGFGTPASKTPKRLDRPSTPRLTRRSITSGVHYSPANNFRKDLAEARRGMEDFQILSRDITRRSVRF